MKKQQLTALILFECSSSLFLQTDLFNENRQKQTKLIHHTRHSKTYLGLNLKNESD